MYKPKLDKEIRCPLEYGMDMFGGKWKSRIICVLAKRGVVRYNELKRSLANITDTVLASSLKELQACGMIERVQYNEIPPRVEYGLTELGQSAVPVIYNICLWSGAVVTERNEDVPICNGCDYYGAEKKTN